MRIGDREIGPGHRTYVIAEIGLNHNGDNELLQRLINAAHQAGADCIKLQKRNPDKSTPEHMKGVMRETPWGLMTYLEYRHAVELDEFDFMVIVNICRALGIHWSASVWDMDSLEFVESYSPAFIKIPSAMIHNLELIEAVARTSIPTIMSTGGADADDVVGAASFFEPDKLALLHSVMVYPCPLGMLNLKRIVTLRKMFPGIPIGYSGHETGLVTSVAAVALGACIVERHITLDRSMWGSDQAASIEPHGFAKMVKYIRTFEEAIGTGEFIVWEEELEKLESLYGGLRVPGFEDGRGDPLHQPVPVDKS